MLSHLCDIYLYNYPDTTAYIVLPLLQVLSSYVCAIIKGSQRRKRGDMPLPLSTQVGKRQRYSPVCLW